jgi:hypothetical protein
MLRTMSLALFSLSLACGVSGDLDLRGRAYSALCDDGQLGLAINSTGKVPDGCVKIEGGQIGQAPLTLQYAGGSLTITSWVSKGDSPGEKVGFTFTSTTDVKYAVKASTRTFVDTTSGWVHPDGTSGPSANGISNITFCPGGGGSGGGADGGFNEGGGGGTVDAGSGGGECGPNGGGGGAGDAGTPCADDSQCGPQELCAGGTCQPQIG